MSQRRRPRLRSSRKQLMLQVRTFYYKRGLIRIYTQAMHGYNSSFCRVANALALATGKKLSAKPGKIVAGHEPEHTNAFLHIMADAIKAKVSVLRAHASHFGCLQVSPLQVSSKEAVSQVLRKGPKCVFVCSWRCVLFV